MRQLRSSLSFGDQSAEGLFIETWLFSTMADTHLHRLLLAVQNFILDVLDFDLLESGLIGGFNAELTVT